MWAPRNGLDRSRVLMKLPQGPFALTGPMIPHEQLVVVAATRKLPELRVPLQSADLLLVHRVLLVRTLLWRTRITMLNAAIA